jgi:hypothetical protein
LFERKREKTPPLNEKRSEEKGREIGSHKARKWGKLVTWVENDPPASTAKLSDACPYIVQSEVFSLLPTRVDLGIDC